MWRVNIYVRGFTIEPHNVLKWVEEEYELDAYDIRCVINDYIPEFEDYESAYEYAKKFAYHDLWNSYCFEEGDVPDFDEESKTFVYDTWGDCPNCGDHVRVVITGGGS